MLTSDRVIYRLVLAGSGDGGSGDAMTTTCAAAVVRVWVRLRRIWLTPRAVAVAAAAPWRAIEGAPLAALTTSISQKLIASPIPVPNGFLRGESGGPARDGVALALAVGLLARGEASAEKGCSLAVDHSAEALYLD
jgi:hypothetical protein